jgi:hypothetical protein
VKPSDDFFRNRLDFLGNTLYFVKGPIVAFYFVFISVSAGKVLPISDDVGDLLLGEPIAFDHRRIVSRIQPGGLSEVRQHSLDPHQVLSQSRGNSKYRVEVRLLFRRHRIRGPRMIARTNIPVILV